MSTGVSPTTRLLLSPVRLPSLSNMGGSARIKTWSMSWPSGRKPRGREFRSLFDRLNPHPRNANCGHWSTLDPWNGEFKRERNTSDQWVEETANRTRIVFHPSCAHISRACSTRSCPQEQGFCLTHCRGYLKTLRLGSWGARMRGGQSITSSCRWYIHKRMRCIVLCNPKEFGVYLGI